MTNVNGVNQGQQVAYVVPQKIYTQQAAPQYTTTPYPNDSFVSSKPKKNNKAGKVLAGTILTAAALVGGAVIARKTGLKNYTKIAENANLRQKFANVAVTVADKSTEYAAKAVNYGKNGIAKAKEAVNKLIAKFGKQGAETVETAAESVKLTDKQLINVHNAQKVSDETRLLYNIKGQEKVLGLPTPEQVNETLSKMSK